MDRRTPTHCLTHSSAGARAVGLLEGNVVNRLQAMRERPESNERLHFAADRENGKLFAARAKPSVAYSAKARCSCRAPKNTGCIYEQCNPLLACR
jgi:hypothetical protein